MYHKVNSSKIVVVTLERNNAQQRKRGVIQVVGPQPSQNAWLPPIFQPQPRPSYHIQPRPTHEMSAPQIPNLLTSRGCPRTRGGRGRGTSRFGGGESAGPGAQRKDLAIQSTDTDAAVSRLSAVSLGYLEDPFASLFVNGEGTRRMPIINRGKQPDLSRIYWAPSLILRRNLHSNDSSRHPHKCLPLSARVQYHAAEKANNITGGRDGYTILSPAVQEEAQQPHLPRVRLPISQHYEIKNSIKQQVIIKQRG